MFLGIDISLRATGVCMLFDSGMYKTLTIPTSANMRMVNRQKLIIDSIEEFIGGKDSHAIEYAAIEGYSFAATGQVFQLAEIGGLVRFHLMLWDIPFLVATPKYVKMFATGHGDADKTFVCEALKQGWGQDFLRYDWKGHDKGKPAPEGWGTKDTHWRNDEADAYTLANIAALYSNAWDREPTPEQRAVIAGVSVDPEGTLLKKAKARKAAQDASRK